MRANVALFHSKFSDMQLQFEIDPTNAAIVESYNAGSATVNGAEFEFLFAPSPDLQIGLSDTVLSDLHEQGDGAAEHDLRPGVQPGIPVPGR